jgi:soluble lytic murein transglycosylase-like protein
MIIREHAEINSKHYFCRRTGLTCVLFIMSLMILDCGSSAASIYMCRDTTGAGFFTNAPTGSNCKAIILPQTGTGWTARRQVVNSTQYDEFIEKVGKNYHVDPSLIKAIIHTESDFNHRAVSRTGAQGLMQLMPETSRELRVGNPFNPKENIDGGTRYFRKLLDNFNGDLNLSLAAYNAGPGLVMRTGGVPQIPETKRYIKKVLKQYRYYRATR